MTAREAAHQLIAREHAMEPAPLDAAATAERVVRRVSDALVEWFGPYGAHALLSRALTHARIEHPALATVQVGTPAVPSVEGLADTARVHGVADATAASVDLLAALLDLLGRLIGDDLAMSLVDQSTSMPSVGPPTNAWPPGGAADSGRDGGGASVSEDATGGTKDD